MKTVAKNLALVASTALGFILASGLVSSCRCGGEDVAEKYLGGAKTSMDDAGGLAKDATAVESTKEITLSADEVAFMREEVRKCRAEAQAFKVEETSRCAAEVAKTELAERQRAAEERKQFEEKIFADASKLIEEMRERLAQYHYSSALVNGECLAVTTTGKRYNYRLKHACLAVVLKTIGNDGELAGIQGAVSVDAAKEGITSIDCMVGRASIKLIAKKCNTAEGTGGGAGKIDQTWSVPREKKKAVQEPAVPAPQGEDAKKAAEKAAWDEVKKNGIEAFKNSSAEPAKTSSEPLPGTQGQTPGPAKVEPAAPSPDLQPAKSPEAEILVVPSSGSKAPLTTTPAEAPKTAPAAASPFGTPPPASTEGVK
jgi:hypothetical protein